MTTAPHIVVPGAWPTGLTVADLAAEGIRATVTLVNGCGRSWSGCQCTGSLLASRRPARVDADHRALDPTMLTGTWAYARNKP